MHISTHSETLIRISQSGNISDSFIDFLRKQKFLGNTWKCIVSIGLASYSRNKGFPKYISKILFDLTIFRIHPEKSLSLLRNPLSLWKPPVWVCPPTAMQTLPFLLPTYRNYKSSFTFSGPPTHTRQEEKENCITCLFLPAFSTVSRHRLS